MRLEQKEHLEILSQKTTLNVFWTQLICNNLPCLLSLWETYLQLGWCPVHLQPSATGHRAAPLERTSANTQRHLHTSSLETFYFILFPHTDLSTDWTALWSHARNLRETATLYFSRICATVTSQLGSLIAVDGAAVPHADSSLSICRCEANTGPLTLQPQARH